MNDTHAILLRRFSDAEECDVYSIEKTGLADVDVSGISVKPEDILFKIDIAHASNLAKYALDTYVAIYGGSVMAVKQAPNHISNNISWIEAWEAQATTPFDMIYTACHCIEDRKIVTKIICDCITHVERENSAISIFRRWANTGEHITDILDEICDSVLRWDSSRTDDLYAYAVYGDILGAAHAVQHKGISQTKNAEISEIIRHRLPLRKLLQHCTIHEKSR